MEIKSKDEDLEKLQNVGQRNRARPQRDVMGGAGRGGPGKKMEEEVGNDKPYCRWGFLCHCSREDGSFLFLLMLGLLSRLSAS